MPNIKKNIFNKKKLNHLVSKFDFKDFENFPEKIATLNRWVAFVQSDAFRATKETALQGNFLNEIFGSVLGYDSRLQNPDEWNLAQEQVTNIDGKFADGALGFFTAQNSLVRAVIELKDPNSELDSKQTRFNDNRTPVEQAFSYQHKTGKECRWVIVSNFNEIRLYHSNSSTEYELFFVSELAQPEKFNQFFYLLNSKNLISKSGDSLIDALYKSNEQDEQDISKEFYSVFKKIRIDLFEHLKANNPNIDELVLLEKTQKLLDRFIFVCFCEDNYLLPEQIFKQIVKNVESSFNFSETKIWNEVRGLFNAINLGSPAHNINKFNGGLFAKDEILDSLVIKDGILKEMSKITEYDFDSDIDVNILGHIFEQSINDLEELKSQIEGKEFDKKTSKRKKDGIFYTPEYITKYIVENAVGGWLEDRKKELGFDELPALSDEDYNFISHKKSKSQSNQNIQKHLQFWNAYRETLKNIKVLDPACGSGAFLNQAFNFLYAEGQKVNDTLALLKGGQHELFELDRHILTNNLYGVDINQESVEITKLSLWLKTANKYSELTALDNNIKCGNSLIDDPAVAGEKAFDWEKEFPVVFGGFDVSGDLGLRTGDKGFDGSGGLGLGTGDKGFDVSGDLGLGTGDKGFDVSGDLGLGTGDKGFDVVIGNPPYGVNFNKKEKEFLSKFDNLVPDYEIYIYFISLYKKILKEQGMLSFIFPNTFLSILYGKKYREELINNVQICNITDLSNDITFVDASVRTCILTFRKSNGDYSVKLKKVINRNFNDFINLKKNKLIEASDNILSLFSQSIEIRYTINKILAHKPLKSYYEVSQGLIPYDKYRGHDEFTIKNRIWHSETKKDYTYKKELKGSDVNRYNIEWNGHLWISYGSWLAAPREQKYFISKRILIREITNESLSCCYTNEEYYNTPSCINIIDENEILDLKYSLVILNSKLIGWLHNKVSPKANKGLFPKILINDVRNIPLVEINKEAQQPFIALADVMLEKNKELQEIKNKFLKLLTQDFTIYKLSTKLQNWYELSWAEFTGELKKNKIELKGILKEDWSERFNRMKELAVEIKRIIDETDNKIDLMVYKLYDLTYEEVKIVEPGFSLSEEEYNNC
ncbi:MAG TPA: N-6 DNA methylase [Candidatus Kapabacteria bacterium]|nr:N-6 DNA methylase [Candidatus Kapabacteria bacterium]